MIVTCNFKNTNYYLLYCARNPAEILLITEQLQRAATENFAH